MKFICKLHVTFYPINVSISKVNYEATACNQPCLVFKSKAIQILTSKFALLVRIWIDGHQSEP